MAHATDVTIKPPTAAPERASSQQAVRDVVDDRRTPASLFNPLHERHSFTLDVAASERNAMCARFIDRHADGLLKSWSGERVWCNPPYSKLEPWVAKAWEEMRNGCELVVMLIPANRCEQPFWQEFVEPFRDREPTDGVRLSTRFVRGRVKFTAPGEVPGAKDSPPFGCVLITWERA